MNIWKKTLACLTLEYSEFYIRVSVNYFEGDNVGQPDMLLKMPQSARKAKWKCWRHTHWDRTVKRGGKGAAKGNAGKGMWPATCQVLHAVGVEFPR